MQFRCSKTAAGRTQQIDAARAGDHESWAALCEEHWQYLVLIAGQHVGRDLQSKVGASDIVQQSMLEAQRSIGQFRGSNDRELRAWLAQIVRRNVIDQARRYCETRGSAKAKEVAWSIAPKHSLAAEGETPSFLVRQAEFDQELIRAVAQLSPRHQQIIEMRHRDGLTHAEIAERLNISVEASRQLWTRAVRHLQQILGTAHEGQQARSG
jgi:RNA polymerase sigma-70 factor (ECF subfamily)